MTGKLLVLIGDIVASRLIKERVAFDATLLAALAAANQRNPNLLSPYTLTIGDEIQAVFSSAASLSQDMVAIQAAVFPQRMRFSFAVGTLVKPVNPLQAIGMDGPAFHLARDAVEALKKTADLYTVSGDGIPQLELLRQSLFLLSAHVRPWNHTRFQTLALLLAGLPVRDIAARLAVSDKAVYKNIRAGALEVVIRLLAEMERLLDAALRSQP